MQPMLVLSSTCPGLLYLNGQFAGESSGETPLMRPIAPTGALYLEFRPLHRSHCTLARRLVFSGGVPLSASVEDAENLNLILWPGGICEIEITADILRPEIRQTQLCGHSFSLDTQTMRLNCDGYPLATLPEGASLPESAAPGMENVLTGSCSGGKYLLTTDSAFRKQTGFLQANHLEFGAEGNLRAIISAEDLVGHATLESWKISPEGLSLISSEPAWMYGSPRWPMTAAETARAWAEAVMVGLYAEAEGYLAPSLRNSGSLPPLSGYDLCVEMKYASPDARPCIGLLRLECDRFAQVTPLYFRAAPSGGAQGPWQLESLELL